jgi:hypothetical protein
MRLNESLPRKRTSVLIGTLDLNFGIKLADWLAACGYQAVLIRSWTTMLDECRELRPQAVVIDCAQGAQSVSPPLEELARGIAMISPYAVVVARGEPAIGHESFTGSDSSLRYIQVRSADSAHIGRLIQTELNRNGMPMIPSNNRSASSHWNAVSLESLSLSVEDTDKRMVCHRCQGLMHPIDPLDPLDTLRPGERETMQAWRCISCGNLIDPVIMRNRHAIATARPRRRSSSPRQPVYKRLTS